MIKQNGRAKSVHGETLVKTAKYATSVEKVNEITIVSMDIPTFAWLTITPCTYIFQCTRLDA